MLSLRELQRRFVDGVLHEDARVTASIVADAFTGEERLRVYRNNTFESLTAALGDVYPVVRRLVGEGFFCFAAHQFIRRYPSRSGNLHDFGRHFPAFLVSFPPAAGLAYLGDVARLEWAWHRAFHAADHPTFPLRRLADVPAARQAGLRFILHSAAHLIASPFPVARLWKLNSTSRLDDASVDLASGGENLLVNRPKLDVSVQRLSPGEYALLQAMDARRCFREACDAATAAEPRLDVGACLHKHVLLNTIVDFEA